MFPFTDRKQRSYAPEVGVVLRYKCILMPPAEWVESRYRPPPPTPHLPKQSPYQDWLARRIGGHHMRCGNNVGCRLH
ncbi:hypothetical protein GDO78_021292 [Eleutherodactylus coqui]|uniref:Uncharacterized protein n=1 Tax=Eleutherodactylus coqui TaxID=57060 RepID=A0A8J6EH05_ELECQ|nr:hypothetical protein GDO78_021292 [Eleutherodactylus coqui]